MEISIPGHMVFILKQDPELRCNMKLSSDQYWILMAEKILVQDNFFTEMEI